MIDARAPESLERIRRARGWYRIAAYITGVLLLLLVAEMLLKYVGHLEVELGGPFGAVALVQEDMTTAFNASRWILIIHGWFYVVYLVASFLLWSRLRWHVGWLIAMAAGGVVPFLSFVMEHLIGRRADREIAAAERAEAARAADDDELRQVEASLSEAERRALDDEVRAEAAARLRD